MAVITKSLFANTSPANMYTIDSLEAAFTTKFELQATTEQLSNSVSFGKSVAVAIFDWSKSDGAHEPYLHITDPGYVPPDDSGLWILTPPLLEKLFFHIGVMTEPLFPILPKQPNRQHQRLIHLRLVLHSLKWRIIYTPFQYH